MPAAAAANASVTCLVIRVIPPWALAPRDRLNYPGPGSDATTPENTRRPEAALSPPPWGVRPGAENRQRSAAPRTNGPQRTAKNRQAGRQRRATADHHR